MRLYSHVCDNCKRKPTPKLTMAASRGKRLVELALKKNCSRPPVDEETASFKVSKWLGCQNSTPRRCQIEMDYDSDNSCMDPDYVPASIESQETMSDQVVNQDKGCEVQGDNEPEPCTSYSQANCSAKSSKQKPKRLCKFCQTWNSHLTRHLKRRHQEEEEVAAALKLPKKEKERAFGGLKKEGIFQANMARREINKNAILIRERSQGSAETVMCSGCRGFYDSKNIFKHKRTCEKNVSARSETVKMSELSDSATAANVDLGFKENILDRFRKHEIGLICRSDLVIVLFGKKQWAKSVKKERSVVMSEMRVLANLIFIFRQESGNKEASGLDILDYRNFDVLENSVRKMCATDDGHDKAGMKVKVGFVLKRSVKVMRGYFVIKEDTQKEADMTRFLDVLGLYWDFIFFTAQVECEQKRGGLRKPSAMPDEEGISTFRKFVIEEIKRLTEQYDFWDRHTFVQMRNLLVARLTMFNARRGGEPARLTLNEWREAITGAWIDPNLVEKIDDPVEKYLVDNLKLAYQSGKGSRKMVPVLLTEDTIEPITKLLSERVNCNVSEQNVFLFPSTSDSLDHASGYHCLKSVVDSCPNLRKPHLLIADKFRHRVSTMFAQLELPEEQRRIFYSHMGHSEAINKNVYQCPLAVREVTQVGKFLLQNVDGNRSWAHAGTDGTCSHPKTNEKEKSPSVAENEQSNNEEGNICLHNEVAVQDDLECGDEVVVQAGSASKLKKERRYTKWTEHDSKLVISHFKHYITDNTNKGRLPGKREVLGFLEKNSVCEGCTDKVKLIKTKVFNEKKKFRNGKFEKM